MLTKIDGIGPVLAANLLKKLPKKPNNEKEARQMLKQPTIFNQLPLITQMDLIHNPNKNVPYSIVDYVHKEFRKHLNKVKFTFAGSYRRKKEILHDIDIVISRGHFKSTQNLIKYVFDKLKKSTLRFSKVYAGEKKISVYIKIKNYTIKTDMFITTPSEYVFALLYATGSGKHNIIMRKQAKNKGYLLNQHGLFNRKTKIRILNLKTERDIFEKLGMTYKKPNKRI